MERGIFMGRFCKKCGKAVGETDQFCQSCGAKLDQEKTVQTVTREEAIASKGKTPAKGCLIVLILVVIVGMVSCVAMMGSSSKVEHVDKIFLESLNTSVGAECTYTMSDHLAYYEEDLQEYIGSGSFTTPATGDLKYTYSYRAVVKDNEVIIIKASVFDPAGVQVLDHYDNGAEWEHLESTDQAK